MTYEDITNAIFSPGSEPGVMPFAAQVGPTIDPYGQVLRLASRSPQPDSGAAQMILAISGPNGSGSSMSYDLQRSLLSRLVARMASRGSILFRLTWKVRVTPLGRSIYALRARGRSTSASGYTSWPTPKVARGDYQYRNGNHNEKVLNLSGAVKLASWPSPRAEERQQVNSQDGYVALSKEVKLTSWATPRSTESGHSTGNPERAENNKSRLEDQVFLASWATPTVDDANQVTRKSGQFQSLT